MFSPRVGVSITPRAKSDSILTSPLSNLRYNNSAIAWQSLVWNWIFLQKGTRSLSGCTWDGYLNPYPSLLVSGIYGNADTTLPLTSVKIQSFRSWQLHDISADWVFSKDQHPSIATPYPRLSTSTVTSIWIRDVFSKFWWTRPKLTSTCEKVNKTPWMAWEIIVN